MSEHIGEPLDDYEIKDFLTDRGLGILGLATDGAAYTLPIAFAFDESHDRCILRFVMGPDSKKRRLVADTTTASLTSFEWHGKHDWKSVVITGPIRQVPDDDLAQAAALFSDLGEEAALDVFNKPLDAFETAWFELEIAEITGRGRFDTDTT